MALDFSVGEWEKTHDSESSPRFVSTDMEWSWGTGDEVRGTGEALLLALNQRDATADLEGPGLDLLSR